jgi:hypothetical protein
VVPGEAIKGLGLPASVTGGAGTMERLLGLNDRFPGLIPPFEQYAQAQAGVCLVGDQASESVAAGGSGEQGPYLLAVAGIVEHDEHAPASQQAAIQSGLGVEGGRDSLWRHL